MIYRSKPAAATAATLATIASGKEAYLTGWACNKSATVEDYIYVYALKAGESVTTDTELYSKLRVPANDTFTFTPIHLDAGESLVVMSQNGTVVFTLTGQEVAK